MTDIVLIRSNDQKNVYGETSSLAACEPPYWIGVISAFLRNKGFTVEVIDAEAYNYSPEEVSTNVREKSPRLIGIIVTGTNLSASTQKMQGAQILSKELKSAVNIPTFMWGLHPSALPVQTLKESPIEFVIKGENFNSISRLLEEIKGGTQNFADIKGLYYKFCNEIKGNAEIDLIDPNEMPSPAWDLLPMAKYHPHNWHLMGYTAVDIPPYGIIATSLGCPFNCSFCAVSALFGEKHVRFKSPEKVIEEIDVLVKRYNIKYIKILDECFVLNLKHVNAICDLLIENDYDLNMWAYARVDTINERILEKLKKAGMQWLGFGIESASEIALGNVNKGQFNLQKTHDAMKMVKESGINIMANFMFGLPEDTIDSMEQTLQLARDINPEFINFYCTMAYPGSELYNQCLRDKIPLPENWIGFSQLGYETLPLPSKYLSSREILSFRDNAFNRFFEKNDAYFNSIRQKFGQPAVDMVNGMLGKRLKRKILDDAF
jgi:radical SAM superfamily enzyme YgiQ (UPF0313 family)